MNDEVTKSQRYVMERAADLANETIQREVASGSGPIGSLFGANRGWALAWRPYKPDYEATFGLKMDEVNYVHLTTPAARERFQEIADEALNQAMTDDPIWVGPMINDLVSGQSFYVRFE